jgi:tRNA nucleotidyltransferase (CCA-adding enzyme)
VTGRLDPPVLVREIVATLERAGFETWCVGGAVRDALLGHPHLDWDIATAARPEKVRELFRRTVPVGIEFGTVGVLDREGTMHEVTTFRRDVHTDGRHAVVEFGASLDDDLARRDFTINAIAYSPRTDEIRDPFGGRDDLGRRVVRAVGDADARMREDRLRALRAIRFAARFEFDIDASTWAAITRSAPFLSRLSRERVKEEIEKTMEQVRRPSRAFGLWRDSGALGALVPALAAQPALAFATLDHLPLAGETGRPERVSARRLNRLTAPFLGLPETSVRAATRDLRLSNADVSWISQMAERWEALASSMLGALSASPAPSDAVLRRWAAATGRTRVGALVRLVGARAAAMRAEQAVAARAEQVSSAYRRIVRIAYRDPIEAADLAVDGDDLQTIGIARGPALGQILRHLLDAVVADPALNRRDHLLVLARSIATKDRPSGDGA